MANSLGAFGNASSSKQALQRGAGAEITGIIKAIFSCKARKEAMESQSLRSVVFFSLCMPTHHVYCEEQAAQRTLQFESEPASQGISPIHPLQRHKAYLTHADEWARSLLTWWDNGQHWESIIRLDLQARLITRQQLRHNAVKTTASWPNFLTREKPGGPECHLWMHSGFTPAWDRNQHREDPRVSASRRLSYTRGRGALISLCSSCCHYSKLLVPVLFCHHAFFFIRVCWSLKRLMLCCFLTLTPPAFIWLKERENNIPAAQRCLWCHQLSLTATE